MFCASNILLFLVFANCKWSVQFTFANEEDFLDVDIFCTLPTTIKMHININKTLRPFVQEPLISCSVFLRRQLTHASNSSVTIPSSVTAETFATVAAFCYDPDILVTPFNVVPLRMAAEILDMADDNDDNLLEKTDKFFDRAVSVNGEIAETVLRSCFRLMPEAEEAASMAGRCIEALLNLTERGNSMSDGWVEAVKGMKLVELFLILDSMRPAKTHDNVYNLVSLYLKVHFFTIVDVGVGQIISTINYVSELVHMLHDVVCTGQ